MSFKTDISALIDHPFGAATPSDDDLTVYLRQSVRDVYQRVKSLRPERTQDFAAEETYTPTANKLTGVTCSNASPTLFGALGHNLPAGTWLALSNFTGVNPDINGMICQIDSVGLTANSFQLVGMASNIGVGANGVCVVLQDSAGHNIGGKEILRVLRWDGADYREATPIPITDWAAASDVGSVKYRSKHRPAWVKIGTKLHVIPERTGTEGAIIYTSKLDQTITHSSNEINYFPEDLERSVVLKASLMSVEAIIYNTLNNLTNAPVMPSFPTQPAMAVINYNDYASTTIGTESMSMPTAPVYNSTFGNITDFTINAIMPVAPVVPTFTYYDVTTAATEIGSFTTSTPVFDTSLIYTGTEDFITDEDPEMAGVGLQNKSADAQIQINKYNEANSVYQAELQLKMKNLDILAQKYMKEGDQKFQADLQKFQGDMSVYQQEVAAYSAQVQKEVQEWQIGILTRYTQQIQDNSALFQADNSRYQAEMQHRIQQLQQDFQRKVNQANLEEGQKQQKASKDMEALIQKNASAIQDYSVQIQGWTAETSGHIQRFSQLIQQNSMKLQNYQLKAKDLKDQYDASILIDPSRMQQGQQGG